METVLNVLFYSLAGLVGIGCAWVIFGTYRDERKALLAGMMRPRNGFSIRLTEDYIEICDQEKTFSSIKMNEVTRTEFIRDNCFDKLRAIDCAIKLFDHSTCLAHVAESDKGFSELLDWVRKHSNHNEIEVQLCS
jgi:hypothetical protein